MKAAIKKAAVAVLSPRVIELLRRVRLQPNLAAAAVESLQPPDWEAVADSDSVWQVPAGWAHGSIAARQVEKWDSFAADLTVPQAFGRSHEAAPDASSDVSAHNTIMTFAYVLGRVLAERLDGTMPTVMDWGGGLGHYHRYARALFPRTPFAYTIKDLEELCVAGRARNPDATFTADDEEAFGKRYDFVFASSALHYSRDVYDVTARLCASASQYFMVTRTPFVDNVDDFIVVQRPERYGYFTEYAGWFLNRSRFIGHVTKQGFELEREFLLAERPHVFNAPEQCFYRGFLFKRTLNGSSSSMRMNN